jgi:hypothetical protein
VFVFLDSFYELLQSEVLKFCLENETVRTAVIEVLKVLSVEKLSKLLTSTSLDHCSSPLYADCFVELSVSIDQLSWLDVRDSH